MYKRQAARLLRDITSVPARKITNYMSKSKIVDELFKHGIKVVIK